jgi:hypothetical protein
MSPEALDQRVRDVAQLYKLGMALKDARRIGQVEPCRQAATEHANDSLTYGGQTGTTDKQANHVIRAP